MNLLVVGGGGREHAVIKKLKENPRISKIYAAPGNGGIAQDAICVPVKATDIEGVVKFARDKKIDLAAVIPDDPLAMGMVDRLQKAGIRAFGPSAPAAEIESSKVFAKNLMKKYHIPTADYDVFDNVESAMEHIRAKGKYPVVVKADGLALGKGVVIAENEVAAQDALHAIMNDKIFGASGDHVIVEEFLQGPEISVLSFTDGETLVPMVASMDHKRAYDGDQGPNTGGMGAVAPNPYYTPEVAERCMKEIFLPTVQAMNQEGRPFRGCLYFGLMLTDQGPKVIEYNCRFGDPETQVVLPLLKTDLLDIMEAVIDGRLAEQKVEFLPQAACCVILASGGYPRNYYTGLPITGLNQAEEQGAAVYYAGVKEEEGKLLTAGGRVLGVTALAETLPQAVEKAYQAAEQIHFDNMHCRKDIGRRAMEQRGNNMAVYRIYVEKKPGFDAEARHLLDEIVNLLQIKSVTGLRLLNRYDVEGIDKALFDRCVDIVFSEPQVDDACQTPDLTGAAVFASEYLPGQYDQRADSCAQCIQFVSQGERPTVRTARVYVLEGQISPEQLNAVKKYVINPVESREASMEKADTLQMQYEIPAEVAILEGFTQLEEEGLSEFIRQYGLAMDQDDIRFCRDYFRQEGRQPTITEIRMIDTYWSDHCRHTTFSTIIDQVEIEDPAAQESFERYQSIRREVYQGRSDKPVTLMDLATVGAKYLKKIGALNDLDESEEINACSVKIDVETEDGTEQWILMFKNETHNHPTEIEPFGGAATCIGGAIRDPLSGRSYVYQAMRVTGAADPLAPIDQTLPGKLPQRKIVQTAAAGYSSYGNQIGLATGLVHEFYHPGYVAKRMEIGAVVGAAPAENIRRQRPAPGDAVILLGGRTGRDGCGGATGSSKAHTAQSLESCGAEVQKGNAPEERKLQRLFRSKTAASMIKRCNDFGAGGVSVAIGELADGLDIDLNQVSKKYEGLDGTELAISESQERMAVVVAPEDANRFIQLAGEENLEAAIVAYVTESPRLTMRWNGKTIVDLSREFLNSNGAEKHIAVKIARPEGEEEQAAPDTVQGYRQVLAQLNVCSQKGLVQRFDSTVGAGTVLMPFGGKNQQTPAQVMVAKLPVLGKETKTCSAMAYGFDPYLSSRSPYLGAYYAVVESVCKLSAAGASYQNCHLTFQEYFEKLGNDPQRWGKPMAALLGALEAQRQLKAAAIGGKDSMSGSFDDIDVPPTLVSFAISAANTDNIISPEFKKPGSAVVLLQAEQDSQGLLEEKSLLETLNQVERLIANRQASAVYVPELGGVGAAVAKMAFGNDLGFAYDPAFSGLFEARRGAFVVELAEGAPLCGQLIGHTLEQKEIRLPSGESVALPELLAVYEAVLEPVFPVKAQTQGAAPLFSFSGKPVKGPAVKTATPRVLIPVFPGANCEYDTARAFEKAGAQPEILVLRNLTAAQINESVERMEKAIANSQIIALPGGFSGGDEPDGSAKFITAFFRNPRVSEAVHGLLRQRDGLMIGVCNGFQALIKLGLLPYGEIRQMTAEDATLTYNVIGRHQSGLTRTRICANWSPWLMLNQVGDIHTVAISHGEGRFAAPQALIDRLAANGQIAAQYVDETGAPSMDTAFNPNGSFCAVEGVTSPDGRIFGKMCHSERWGDNLYKNVPGNKDQRLFEGAVRYYAL